jgi:2',3'-cyclic-nucleotide 2'-phosphodiesterase (5'-nucleotidase family)
MGEPSLSPGRWPCVLCGTISAVREPPVDKRVRPCKIASVLKWRKAVRPAAPEASPRSVQSSLGPAAVTWCVAVVGLSACGGPAAGTAAAQRSNAAASGPDTRLSSAAQPIASRNDPIEISIVGTSDLHGHIETLPLFAGYVDALRAARPGRVALVDAGDMFQGTLESNLEEGAVVIDAYIKLGYATVTIGNHEFDYGPVGPAVVVLPGTGGDPRGALKARAAQAAGHFPFLAANLLENGRPVRWPNVLPSAMVRVAGGVDIGIIGVTTMDTPTTTISANFVGLAVTPIESAVVREADWLRSRGAEIVVVAAHAGGRCTRFDHPDDLSSCEPDGEIFRVARALPPRAVDMIVAGHTHQGVAHRIAGIPIVQSYAHGKAFGRVDLTWDPAEGHVVAARIHPPTEISAQGSYEGAKVQPSAEIARVIQPAVDRASVLRTQPLGVTLQQPFRAAYLEESSLGNLVASLMLEMAPDADVAITNAGGLRADLPQGPLVYGSLYDALPFDNRPARVTMTGRSLAEMFRRNLGGRRGILSIAGAQVDTRCGPGGIEVRLFRVDRAGRRGKLIREDERVVVLTSDFLATGGDQFDTQSTVTLSESAPPIRESIADLLRKRGGVLRPDDWLRPKQPRITLPGRQRPFCGQ